MLEHENMSQNNEKYNFHDVILHTSYFMLMLGGVNMGQNHEKYDFYDLILNTSYSILHTDVRKCKYDLKL